MDTSKELPSTSCAREDANNDNAATLRKLYDRHFSKRRKRYLDPDSEDAIPTTPAKKRGVHHEVIISASNTKLYLPPSVI